MSERGYSAKPGGGMAPGVYEFNGPGMPPHGNHVWLEPEHAEHASENVARLLSRAFEAGKDAAREEIRSALGIYDTRTKIL